LYLRAGEKIFICAKDLAQQQRLAEALHSNGIVDIFLIGKGKSITLTPEMRSPIQVVITTISHVEGYSITDRRVAINPVVFSSLPSREQRDARLNRISQPSPVIRLINIHGGIISYIYQKYKRSKTLADALKGFAIDVGSDIKEDLMRML